MSNADDPIERLTEIARRVFPGCEDVYANVELDQTDVIAAVVYAEGRNVMLVEHDEVDRALDALKAALLVLAGEPSAAEARVVELEAQLADCCWDDRQRAKDKS
jgi:hypothetical protein